MQPPDDCISEIVPASRAGDGIALPATGRESACKCCYQEEMGTEVHITPHLDALPVLGAPKEKSAFPVFRREETPVDQDDIATTKPLKPISPVPEIVGFSILTQPGWNDGLWKGGELIVELIREGPQWSNLGVLVSPRPENGDQLVIDEIDVQGLLGEWNAQQRERRDQVRVGDVIIAVNDRSGENLIKQIQQSSARGCRVKLCISRNTFRGAESVERL